MKTPSPSLVSSWPAGIVTRTCASMRIPGKLARPVELLAWILGLLWVNAPVFQGGLPTPLIFWPAGASDGAWWQCLTFPWVHVNVYHLLLDGSAFLSLYALLDGSVLRRLCMVLLCTVTSWLAALTDPAIYTHGLCGLSGVAHGLMAYMALLFIAERKPASTSYGFAQIMGLVCFALVVAKSAWEAASGQVHFQCLHLACIGMPNAACHAGGVLGGLAAWWCSSRRKK